MTRHTLFVSALLASLLAVAWLAFSLAFSGPFFFDDFAHLPKLAGSGDGTNTTSEVLRLAFPTHGGSGRSLAYLSLLIDDYTWPTSPEGFKRTNLLIHLLNGVLVFVFLRQLARLPGHPKAPAPAADWIALAGMGLWLLHPIHLSPTMMVIQRMTLLGGTFSLLALMAYLQGRCIAAVRPVAGAWWMVAAFSGALILGLMSKETAFMVIAYVAALELTVLGPDRPPRPRWWNVWATVFLILPLGLLAAYLLVIAGDLGDAYRVRAFSLVERLLTEGRILLQYLRVIAIPSATQTGPFRDDFEISHGLFDPPETAAALAAIVVLIGLAAWARRRYPLLSLAVLWFFLGHLLEGTVLPLELYFEHRNYLPMLGPIFALTYWVMGLKPPIRRLAAVGLLGFLTLEAVVTHASAQVWGNHAAIAVLWSAEHPGSPRAQIVAINYYAAIGDSERLKRQLDMASAADPRNASYPLFRWSVERCSDQALPALGGDMNALEVAIPAAQFEYGSLENIQWLLDKLRAGRCRITPADMERIFGLYLANPRFRLRADTLYQLYTDYARLKLQQGDLGGTIQALDAAYEAKPYFETALNQAYLLATAGLFDEADNYIERAVQTPPSSVFDWFEKGPHVAETRQLIGRMRAAASSPPP